jgi:hypothetical protein
LFAISLPELLQALDCAQTPIGLQRIEYKGVISCGLSGKLAAKDRFPESGSDSENYCYVMPLSFREGTLPEDVALCPCLRRETRSLRTHLGGEAANPTLFEGSIANPTL